MRLAIPKITNDDGQAVVIMMFVLAIVFCMFYWIMMNPIMDKMNEKHQQLTTGVNPAIPVSQERQDAIFVIQLAYTDYPIIVFILIIFAAIAAGLRNKYSTV